jgi:hypothetical protein
MSFVVCIWAAFVLGGPILQAFEGPTFSKGGRRHGF